MAISFEVAIDNAKMQIHCHDNPPIEYRFDPTEVDNFDSPSPVVIFGDVWNDSDDGTYAEFGDSSSSANGAHGFLNQVTPVASPTYTGGPLAQVTLHFRASASGDSTHQPLMVEMDRSGPGYGNVMRFHGGSSLGRASDPLFNGPGADWDIPNDDVIRDYSTSITQEMLDESGWDSLDEIRDDFVNGGLSLYFWADAMGTAGSPTYPTGLIRIYEAWIIVKSAT